MITPEVTAFAQLQLAAPLIRVLADIGYEAPSPIQAQTIPLLLAGRDVLGQAQTGTGKTAAFALPVLSRLDLTRKDPQVLVLAPTRELAIQVAEAFQTYAGHLQGFHVLPVYGGQDYSSQIRALRRGVHVVVGTPGRVMDHMRRGTLKLEGLKTLVLDEADEMLRMGFIDDVEWILEQAPASRQIALFSATMPAEIRRIANHHLKDPAQVTISARKATTDLIRQRVWPVSGTHKLDALTRILEAEPFDAMLVFVRTRITTTELAEKLAARGFAAAALNGDIAQAQRERTVEKLKKGQLDILVATDVAARGLDVDRISHVINYDIPHDTEAYIHRIGRTGRAGRKGDAILFVAPREKRMLAAIERATGARIEQMELPSTELINDRRIAQFKQTIADTLAAGELGFYSQLIEQYQLEHNVPAVEIAAALAQIAQGDSPLLLRQQPATRADKPRGGDGADQRGERGRRDKAPGSHRHPRDSEAGRHGAGSVGSGSERSERSERGERSGRGERSEGRATRLRSSPPDKGLERYRLEVGHNDQVMPGNIVGAIANEAGLDSKDIGRITIFDSYSTVDLPPGMPADIFRDLKNVWVAGKKLNITRFSAEADGQPEGTQRLPRGELPVPRKPKPKSKPKPKPKPKPKRKSKPMKKLKNSNKPAKRGKPKRSQ